MRQGGLDGTLPRSGRTGRRTAGIVGAKRSRARGNAWQIDFGKNLGDESSTREDLVRVFNEANPSTKIKLRQNFIDGEEWFPNSTENEKL